MVARSGNYIIPTPLFHHHTTIRTSLLHTPTLPGCLPASNYINACPSYSALPDCLPYLTYIRSTYMRLALLASTSPHRSTSAPASHSYFQPEGTNDTFESGAPAQACYCTKYKPLASTVNISYITRSPALQPLPLIRFNPSSQHPPSASTDIWFVFASLRIAFFIPFLSYSPPSSSPILFFRSRVSRVLFSLVPWLSSSGRLCM
jgi:hypothetical protein